MLTLKNSERKESMNNMNHEELLLKNQAIILLSLLAMFSKMNTGTPEDQKLAQAISEQIDKTCAVLPDDKEEEGAE